jgi:4-hydroxy-2-oxoheptanedioate aldolase
MTINTAKRRLLAGQPAIGASAVLGSPLAAELLARAGFDFVVVDCQHGNWEDDTALQGFRAISLGAAVAMARVRRNDFYAIGRLLDRGCLGIIVPLVNSAAEARAAAQAVRYPPRGGRSWGPFLASYLGADYGDWANDEVFLAVQIESAQAVEQAEEILAVDGVDGCWIGPKDLARSMGVDVNIPAGRQAHEAAILQVLAASRKTHKIPGIDASGEANAQRWLEPGFQFVTVTSDAKLLSSGGPAILDRLRRPA